MRPNSSYILIGLASVSLLFIVLWLSIEPFDRKRYADAFLETPASERKDFFIADIDRSGAERAYAMFRETFSATTSPDSHFFAHIFGEALAERSGVAGVEICDASFSFGCFHGLSISLFEKDGTAAFFNLAKKCREKFGDLYASCEHGLGHGLLVFFGPENLIEALSECEKPGTHPTGGCRTGVIMEYNSPQNADHTGSITRLLDERGWHEPCNRIPARHRPACYTSQPQWWESLTQGDYRRMGELCGELKVHSEWEACLNGIGTFAASRALYDLHVTQQLCDRMPDSKGKTQCIFAAAHVFFTRKEYVEQGRALCRSLTGMNQTACFDLEQRQSSRNS